MKEIRVIISIGIFLMSVLADPNKQGIEVKVDMNASPNYQFDSGLKYNAPHDLDHHFKYDHEYAKESNEPTSVGSQIRDFMKRLKAFTHDKLFDFEGFRNANAELKEQLLEINSWAKEAIHHDDVLSKQLTFAERVFRTMTENAELLDFHSSKKTLASSLICRVAQLNVQLLGLQDSEGEPDPWVKGYIYKLASFRSNVKFWEEIFMELDNVSITLFVEFYIQITKAKKSIEELEGFFPKERARRWP
ncbi:hypothetical protein JCM33374_g3773 [Metschnikowia sp. JCM 33374]|nr:hypothetical protein JCM33374_g3773 [Metschnikowia sp. JCM 33374]